MYAGHGFKVKRRCIKGKAMSGKTEGIGHQTKNWQNQEKDGEESLRELRLSKSSLPVKELSGESVFEEVQKRRVRKRG